MRDRWPIALTIAGSDSGGGAGVQADLKTFASLRVHGTSAVTCLTAQHPRAVLGIQPCRPSMVARQIEAVLAELPPRALKTGMLYSRAVIEAVASALEAVKGRPLVLDPVMVATSGAGLLRPAAIRVLRERLFPRAALLTPNLDEAALLVGRPLREVEDLREAARTLHREYGVAVLAKGGHLRGLAEAVDIFYDGREELLLRARFVRGVRTHGTGCTYSAAITAYLALGHPLRQAVTMAKEHVTRAIEGAVRAGSHDILNPFFRT